MRLNYSRQGDIARSIGPPAHYAAKSVRRADAGLSIAAILFVLMLWLSNAAAQTPALVNIIGRVTNSKGVYIANAQVRLEHAGSLFAEIRTGADGSFTFRDIPEGDYILSADNGGHRTAPLAIHAKRSEAQPVILIVEDSKSAPAVAMEFADDPKFTVVAVTV